jgi:hypothetical protein
MSCIPRRAKQIVSFITKFYLLLTLTNKLKKSGLLFGRQTINRIQNLLKGHNHYSKNFLLNFTKGFQVFDGVPNNDGKPIRLALPIDEHPQDTDLRIYQAIQTIAGVEDRSIKEVVADIKQIEAINNVALELKTT